MKKILIWWYLQKHLQISPKSDTLIFDWLVGNAVSSKTALRIFLIFCMKLGNYKGRKVTEPHFWKILLIWRYSRKGLQISLKSGTLIWYLVCWLVGNAVFSGTGLIIFLIFCIKLGDSKGRKVTELDFSKKKKLDLELFRKTSPNCPKIRHFHMFLKNGSNDFFVFWPEVSTKYDLQFGWNLFLRKICYLEIFDLKIGNFWCRVQII